MTTPIQFGGKTYKVAGRDSAGREVFSPKKPGAVALKAQTANAAPGVPYEICQNSHFPFTIKIHGQIRGGKNNMVVTRGGLHFPKPEWAKWRDLAVALVQVQLSGDWNPISKPVNVRVTYVAGDRRRRDCPAIFDAVWHVLEKAGVVADDTLLWPVESSRSYDKDSPRCEIEFLP